MNKILITTLFCLCWLGLASTTSAAQEKNHRTQKVGIVLSGGGAKGLMHIGVLKALEENGIPIDCIAGTSMGAIVGGMYAAGYTPDQILQTAMSDQFKYWSTGVIQNKYKFYFKSRQEDASLLSMSFMVNEKGIRPVLPTGFVPSYQMELAFLDLFAKAGSAANQDFNKLMIPFRSVSFNSFNQKAYIGRTGDLGQAVRSSMTFPLLYKPAVLEDSLLFDGGIVNNFPWDVMQQDFSPDFMIGSKCTRNTNAFEVNNQDLFGQMDLLMMAQTNYEMPEHKSILLDGDLSNYAMLDFDLANEIVQKGYDLAISMMDSIKSRVKDRVSPEERSKLRQDFLAKQKPLTFKQINVTGIKGEPEKYVKNTFRSMRDTTLSYDKFLDRYFSLVADHTLSDIIPTATYNPTFDSYDLNLRVTPAPNVDLAVGGYFSSSNNLGFIDVQHTHFGKTIIKSNINAYLGKAYSSFKLGSRHNFYFSNRAFAGFVDVSLLSNKYDYYLGSPELYLRTARPTSIINTMNGLRLDVGLPLSTNSFFRLVGGACYQIANYYQTETFTNTDAAERSKLYWIGLNATFERNSFNNRAYPTLGGFQQFVIGTKKGNQMHRLGSTWTDAPSNLIHGVDVKVGNPKWTWASMQVEEYIPIASKFSLGLRADGSITNKGHLVDYQSTMLQLPAFTPNPFTKSLLMEQYRGAGYVAGGIIPVLYFESGLQFRTELYAFQALYALHRNADQSSYYGDFMAERINWMAFASLIYTTKFGPISVSVSNFNWLKSKTYATIGFGFLIFNKNCFD